MLRHPRSSVVVPAALCLVAAMILVGCNVLFVPQKPNVSPSPTPDTAVHQFPELEAHLPNTVGTEAIQKFSLSSDPSLSTPKTLEVLRRLGKTPADVELAKGFVTASDTKTISAMRIVGADANQAAADFEVVDESDPNTTTTYLPAIVVGKRVLVRTTGQLVEYMYPLGDIIFIVGGSRTFVEAALTAIK